VDDVDFFYGLGQRISQLTYNTRNRVGNGCFERRDGGLSDYGVEVVERMNEVGMAIDVSHCGDQTTLDAFEVSSKPVLITHSNARSLAPKQMRCKTDEALRAMARAGSIIGLTGVRMFVRDTEPTTIEHVLDHFDHVAKLVGVEHIAVGSDMDLHGYDATSEEAHKQLRQNLHPKYGVRAKLDIEGIDHPKRMYDLTEGLIRRRYSDSDIEGILGGHMKRVLGEIW
jgi:membrane dipeptidase